MEGLTSSNAHVRSLQLRAAALASAGPSLAALIDAEASRLRWKDEASRLVAWRSSIMQELAWARSMEDAASYGESQARLMISLGELVVGGAIRMATEDKRWRAFSDHLLNNIGGKGRPFGTVMVCIGPRGVPDDVSAISISELARESGREEPQVIGALERHGYLLLSERAFSLLMDRLGGDIQEGRLSLPIPTEKLSELVGCPRPVIEQSAWVPVPRPR